MRWIVLLGVAGMLVACGGPKIPMHAGYKNEKNAKPWKKPKHLKLDDRNEAKSEGDLSYKDYRRAKWFDLELPSHGTLAIKLEITPPGDGGSDDFDLAIEVLDPGFRVIAKSDLEEGDAGELTKTKQLLDLDPGTYLIHLYLQNRMDTADYVLRATFTPTKAPEEKSDFPAQVLFVPQLPMVPEKDDCVGNSCKPKPPVVVRRPPRGPRPPPPKKDDKPVATPITGRIIAIAVVGNGTRITIGRGTATGAQPAMVGKLSGIATTFAVACNENTCSANVPATPDQVRGAGGSVTLVPTGP